MPGRDLRPHGCAPTHIEMNQLRRHRISRDPGVLHDQLVGYPGRTEARALERQKCDLLRRVEATQVRIELEAIDDARTCTARTEKHVFRA